ncbi:MAG: DoxX family protein [Bacteroidetes bacterium]|nr:DoxX family protein [Bacteroidota bacterium]
MDKKANLIYWITTCWSALGMLSTGIVQVLNLPEEVQKMALLGFPAYFIRLIGIWKIAGVIVILLPKLVLIKEWAYAGFFFTMTGALVAHFVNGDAAKEFFGPSLLLVLTMLSWYFRPADRKIKH